MGIFVYMPASFAAAAGIRKFEKLLRRNGFSPVKNYVYFLMSFSPIFRQLFIGSDALKNELLALKQFYPAFLITVLLR